MMKFSGMFQDVMESKQNSVVYAMGRYFCCNRYEIVKKADEGTEKLRSDAKGKPGLPTPHPEPQHYTDLPWAIKVYKGPFIIYGRGGPEILRSKNFEKACETHFSTRFGQK